MSLERYQVLQLAEPLLEIDICRPAQSALFDLNNVTGFTFERVPVEINPDSPLAQTVTEMQLPIITLAAMGLRNFQIAHMLIRSEDTIKTHMQHAFRTLEHTQLKPSNIHHVNRYSLPKYLFAVGFFKTTALAKPFPLSKIETEIVDAIANGQDNKGVATLRERSRLTIKSHLARIINRTGWKFDLAASQASTDTRTNMVMRALLSREIDFASFGQDKPILQREGLLAG